MPAVSNELRPDELSWLVTAFRRYIVRSGKYLERIESEELTKCLTEIADAVALFNGLFVNRIVRVEDRMNLVDMLRYQRKMLLASWMNEEVPYEVMRPEVDFIEAFLKRLSKIDWEALGIPDAVYNPARIWGSFRVTEAQVSAMFNATRITATYVEPFASLGIGSVVTLTTEDDDDDPVVRIISVRITRMHPCESRWDEGGPNGLLFEGDVTSEPLDADGGDEVFGFLFPGGHAAIVGSSPDSDFTDRHLRTALAILYGDA